MTPSSRTLRLFVSSTFDDFIAERDALQRGVYSVTGELLVESPFRRLRQRCVAHGSDLEIVDLRWGISAAASASYATMHRCLAEVRRAITAPHPNFLALVGDRYGWQPVPTALPSARFADMIAVASPEDAELLREWYRLETNHIPAGYVLRSERGVLPTALERRLRCAVRDTWIASGGTPDRRFGSATEQEIRLALEDRAVGDRSAALCFHRRIVDLDSGGVAARFQDQLPDGSPDEDSMLALAALVDDLRRDGRVVFREYEVAWLPEGPAADVTYLAQFAEDAHAELDRRVGETLEQLDRRGPSEEHEAHAAFAADRRRVFIGRLIERETVEAYLSHPATGPLVVSGPGGSGKSTLLAWTAAAAERLGHRVQQRFIGISVESSVGDQLAAALVTEAIGAGATPLGDPIDALGTTLSEPPLVSTTVVIDGMDLLPDGDELAGFRWLPEPWPSRLRVLVATRSDDDVTRLRRIQSNTVSVRLGSLTETEATTMFNTLLDATHRAVSSPQRALVAAALAHGVTIPLYVRMLASLALSWSVADDVDAPARDLNGVIRQLFNGLSAADRHGAVLVAAVCRSLAASRLGLASAELLDTLSTDEQVMVDFRRRHPDSPPVDVLPTIVWSALRADLDPYLGARSSDGLALIDFFHLDLRLVAARYLDGPQGVETHRRLAELFTRRGTSEGHWLPRAKRPATEAGHHRLAAGDNHVFDTLVRDGSFVLAAAAGQGDFKAGQATPRVNPAAELIVQLRRRGEGDLAAARAAETLAAGREVLAVYPQGAAQLLANDGFPIAGSPEFAGLWARRVGDAPRPSQGHGSPVTALAMSEDGTHIASGDLEGRVGWWTNGLDLQWCHAGHKGWVTAVAISPDGRTLASSGDDGAVLLWDTATMDVEPLRLPIGLGRPQAGPLGFADATCLLFFWWVGVLAADLDSGSVRQLPYTSVLEGKGLLEWEEPEQVVFAGSRLAVCHDSEADRTGDVAVVDVLNDSPTLHHTTPYGTGSVALDQRRMLLSSADGFRLFDLARPADPPRHAAGPTCRSLSSHRTLGFVGLEWAFQARILGIGDDLDQVVIARLPARYESYGTPHRLRSSPGTDLIAVSWTSGRISVVDPVVGKEVAVSAGSPRIVKGAIDRRGQIGGGAIAGATSSEARQFALVSATNAPVITTPPHTDQIIDVASSTSGELVSVDRVGVVVVHHNEAPERLAIGAEISSACEWRDVDGVAVGTTDSRVLLIGSEPAEIDIGRSRLQGRVPIANLDAQGNPPTVAVALPNGLTAWSHGDDIHWRPQDPPDTITGLTAVRLLANGNVADGSSLGWVRVWDPSMAEPILSWDAHAGAVQSFQEIGEHLLLSAGASGSIFIVDLRNTTVVGAALIFGGLAAVRVVGHELVVLRRDGWLARYVLEGITG